MFFFFLACRCRATVTLRCIVLTAHPNWPHKNPGCEALEHPENSKGLWGLRHPGVCSRGGVSEARFLADRKSSFLSWLMEGSWGITQRGLPHTEPPTFHLMCQPPLPLLALTVLEKNSPLGKRQADKTCFFPTLQHIFVNVRISCLLLRLSLLLESGRI